MLLLNGCAMYAEGQGFEVRNDEEDWREIKTNWSANSALPEAELADDGTDGAIGAIVIGRVGPFRSFADAAVFEKAYEKHVRDLSELGLGDKILSREQLQELAVGWTTVTHHHRMTILGIVVAFVPDEMVGEIDYPAKAGTFLLGTREDLVAARITAERPYWMISRRLCELEAGFHLCLDDHPKGLYDAVTGRQLNSKFELKTRGRRIDPQTLAVN